MNLSNQNVIHQKIDGVEFLQFRKLLQYQNILSHAYTIGTKVNYRTSTVNKEPLPKEVYKKAIQDYQHLCNAIGEDYKKLVKTNQTHSDHVISIHHKIKENEPDFNLKQYQETDGLITNQPNLLLSTTNADCILLLFFDPIQKVIANIHSGWRGTIQRISAKTIQKMQKEYQCKPQDIICCICPSIRKCHFEVGKEVKDMFWQEFQDLNNIQNQWIEKKKDNQENQPNKNKKNNENKEEKWYIDTIAINQQILKKEGLKPENIIDSGICSVCQQKQIHSYRAEKQDYGLETALIGLRDRVCLCEQFVEKGGK